MRIVGIVIALIFALAAFLLAYNVLGQKKEQAPIVIASEKSQVEEVNVVVAKRQIDLGEVIDESMLDSKIWPKHLVLEGFASTEEKGKSLLGQVARTTFLKGQPINLFSLSNPEDPNFIAANLPSGMRMVTLSSDAVAGLAGFVYPGDRVDVVITRKHPLDPEDAKETGIRERSVTETLVSNIKVLAVNQRATLEVNTEGAAREQARDRIPSSVSVEVTLEDAQRIRLAQDLGYVSLVLRSLEDKTADGELLVTTEGELTNYEHPEPKGKEDTDLVGVVRGVIKTDMEVPSRLEEEEEVGAEEEVVE
jgi:pilus assembly protein CpaB